MDVLLLREEFNEALKALEAKASELAHAICSETALPAEVVPGSRDARKAAADVYCAFDYASDDVPAGAVVSLVGAIAATEPTLALARAVNLLKDELASIKLTMDKVRVPHPKTVGETLSLYNEHVRYKLKRSRFHLVQATRHILVLDQHPYPPKRIGFVMASNDRKIETLTWQAVHDRLSRKKDAVAIEADLVLLDSLPHDELFAHAVPASPHVRANIAWQHPDRTITRLQRRVAMPLLYPYKEGEPPVLSGPRLGPSQRAKRLDVQLEETPVSPIFHIYRYRAPYRRTQK
jgi:hypothetical protein